MNTCVDILLRGGIVLFPCDTIWGLLCKWDADAVEKLYAIKKRPSHLPLVSLIKDIETAKAFTLPWSKPQEEFIHSRWPGPTTLVLEKTSAVPDFVTANAPTIALRVPLFSPLNTLLEACDAPLVSTSVNISGTPFAKTLEDVPVSIKEAVDHIEKTFQPGTGAPSSLIDLTHIPPKILR
jgi:L-threonylcarbamoyladenylate synthase